MGAVVRYANNQDMESLIHFLERANVGIEGVRESIEYFLIMEDEKGEIKGTLGIEPCEKVGLLRSLVLAPNSQEKDILILFDHILTLAKQKDITELYLATNKMSSVHFFQLLGFKELEKAQLPESLRKSRHVQEILTVDNSCFLRLSL